MTTAYSLQTIEAHPNLSVPWYLIAMYSENILCDPLLSKKDAYFLSRFLIKNFESITHPHKRFVTLEELEDVTLFLEESSYPSLTRDATEAMIMQKNYASREKPSSNSS